VRAAAVQAGGAAGGRVSVGRPCRLHDIIQADRKLTLVFEFADQDLKSYMEKNAELLRTQPFVTKARSALRGPWGARRGRRQCALGG